MGWRVDAGCTFDVNMDEPEISQKRPASFPVLARRFRVGKLGKIKPRSPMYHFEFLCCHPGVASGGSQRGSLQDVLTTIMCAASRGLVYFYVSACSDIWHGIII